MTNPTRKCNLYFFVGRPIFSVRDLSLLSVYCWFGDTNTPIVFSQPHFFQRALQLCVAEE